MDGIDLKHFVPGQKYDVGSSLGALMLAEGWAVPFEDAEPGVGPFKETEAYTSRVIDRPAPPNLIREAFPPYADALPNAADFERRRRRRAPKSSQH